MPRLLALDGSTVTLHLGAAGGGRDDAVVALPGGAEASQRLLPAVTDLLQQAGLALADLDALAYGRGPGAFTGLRSVCAVVQGLALGLDKPVIGIPSLLALAEAARVQHQQALGGPGAGAGTELTVWAIGDARMGQAYAARYRCALGPLTVADAAAIVMAPAWSTLQAPALYDPPELAQAIAACPHDHLAGPGVTVFAAVLADAGQARWPDASPDGAALLRLARAAWQRGEVGDAAQAQPEYIRDKVAQTVRERADAALVARAEAAARAGSVQ